MALSIAHTTVNARNSYALSVWWADLLGFAENPEDPNEPHHEECMIYSPDRSQALLFITVDGLQESGRMHFDLRPEDLRRDEAVATAIAMGATEVADRRTADGGGWVVLADPEGNVFCVLRSDAERAEAAAERAEGGADPA